MARNQKCYFAVHGRYGNEYTHLGCNKRKALSNLKKLEKNIYPDHAKLVKI
jgi:hypothetical protein